MSKFISMKYVKHTKFLIAFLVCLFFILLFSNRNSLSSDEEVLYFRSVMELVILVARVEFYLNNYIAEDAWRVDFVHPTTGFIYNSHITRYDRMNNVTVSYTIYHEKKNYYMKKYEGNALYSLWGNTTKGNYQNKSDTNRSESKSYEYRLKKYDKVYVRINDKRVDALQLVVHKVSNKNREEEGMYVIQMINYGDLVNAITYKAMRRLQKYIGDLRIDFSAISNVQDDKLDDMDDISLITKKAVSILLKQRKDFVYSLGYITGGAGFVFYLIDRTDFVSYDPALFSVPKGYTLVK
ncbi:MAG: hypothetical protein ABDH21_06450 [bacterium]